MTELEEKIGYEFRDPALLDRALTTPACRMSNPQAADNQRLEFLGDAVFGLLSADAVFAAYPDEQEGRLTVRRTHLVSGTVLAEAGERIGLEKFLKRNAGAHPLPPHAKVIADTMEAVMGAVWLDGGLAAAQGVFAGEAIFTLASISAAEVFAKLACISIIAPELYVAGGFFGRLAAVNCPSTDLRATSLSSAVE